MTLQGSGQISLNQIHVEAAGSSCVSGTQASLNDSDIRSLIGAPSGQTDLAFKNFYGTSAAVALPAIQLTQAVSLGATGTAKNLSSYNSISDTVNISAMPSNGTGKRLFVMVAGMRDWNGSIRLNRYNQFNNMKVGSATLTEVAEGHSDYNSSAIGIGFGNQTGTQTLVYNINTSIGGGTGYIYLFVLDYVSNYIWTNYTYNTRASSYSVNPNTTVTYNSSYAGKKELLIFGGNTSNSSSNWNWMPNNGRSYTRLGGFDNGTSEWHTCYYGFSEYGPAGTNHAIRGTYSGSRAPNGVGAAAALIGLK